MFQQPDLERTYSKEDLCNISNVGSPLGSGMQLIIRILRMQAKEFFLCNRAS